MSDVVRAAVPSDRPVLLDCGMGGEIARRGIENREDIWSANALMVAPEVVRQIHVDCIRAGADVIITDTYSVVRSYLALAGIEDRFEELSRTASRLANEARDEAGRDGVLIAGSLATLHNTMNPNAVERDEVIRPLYQEAAELLAPHVDLFLCESMQSSREARAAALAARSTGLPVWVSWTLADDASGLIRSGESIDEAAPAIADLPVSAVLANCCWPESVTAAMPALAARGGMLAGGYANCITHIPNRGDWLMHGEKETDGLYDGLMPLRGDLGPTQFAEHAQHWLDAGADIIGGCCGTGAGHVARMRELRPNTDTSAAISPTA